MKQSRETMIEIDGSYGEGGGQILRTALSLSCLFQKPFRIFNIRKGRKKPGLMPQHITSVNAAQLLSDAEVKGDHIGSKELSFSPKGIKRGDFFFDIGTAGSTSLVLQTLIPALAIESDKNISNKTIITLKGGTHVPFSPPFHYLSENFAFLLKRIGIKIHLSIESYGFYPKGGGKVRAEIVPSDTLIPLTLIERGDIVRMRVYSGVGNLPLTIAQRQKNSLLEKLSSLIKDIPPPIDIELLDVSARGKGTFIFLLMESKHSIAGFTALGERGKMAESVGEEVAKEFIQYFSTRAALDPHMADQLVLYLSICKEESTFTTSRITGHLMTNLWAIRLFHHYRYTVEGEIGKEGVIKINPKR